MKVSSFSFFFHFALATMALLLVHGQEKITEQLFEQDIIPDFNTISNAYDDTTVKKLVDEGILKQSDYESSIVARGTSPHFPIWNMKMNAKEVFVATAYIDQEYSEQHYTFIKSSLENLARRTGVLQFKFPQNRPIDGRPFLSYGRHTGGSCASYVGLNYRAFTSEGQPIYLDHHCMNTGTIQHETLHALGTSFAYIFGLENIVSCIRRLFEYNKPYSTATNFKFERNLARAL